MSDAKVARRYARALVEIAVEDHTEDRVLVELQDFCAAIAADGKELRNALCSPMFSAEERIAVLSAVGPRLGLSKTTTNFLRLLAERGRVGLIDEVRRIYTTAMDERAGRVRVEIYTTDPLTPQREAGIRETFQQATGKTVVLDARIDKSLIGGLVARIGDRVYDASLRSRLEDIKRRLLNAPVSLEA